MAKNKRKEQMMYLDLEEDAANADWIRAARLKKAADAGDKEAARKLEELENTPMSPVDEDEVKE